MRPDKLALYAVAVRILQLIVTVPGFVMAAGIPGLARQAGSREQLTDFAGTLASWIAMTALPVCLLVGVFAHPLIDLVFGSQYDAASPVMRVLMVAGVVSLGTNVTGIVLMTKGIVGPQILFNGISLTVNIVGNIVLVPHFGIMASAWLTAVCEGISLTYGLVVLRRHLSWRGIGLRTYPPVVSAIVAACVGLLLGSSGVVAVLASVAAFMLAMTLLRGWPQPLSQAVARRFSRSGTPAPVDDQTV